MKTVYQTENEFDCGAACVAMLLDWSLQKAHGEIYRGEKVKRTKTNDLRRVLGPHLPVAKGKRRRLLKSGLKSLNRHALVFGVFADGNKHWTVWDAQEKCLRDPQGFSRSFKMTSYLPVGRSLK